jgi:hypothetical protein
MRIVVNKSLEDCFTESLTQELSLDANITEDFIFYLGKAGDLQYFPTFSRPFFRIDVKDRYTLTGIKDTNSIRVTLCHENMADNIKFLNRLICEY